MSRYDGLIIPRSYSEYINKTDAATLQQALQLSGVLSNAVAESDNKAVTSDAVFNAIMKYDFTYYLNGFLGLYKISVPYLNNNNSSSNGAILIQGRSANTYLLNFYAFVNEASLETATDVGKVTQFSGNAYQDKVLEQTLKWTIDTTNKKVNFLLKKGSGANSRLSFKIIELYTNTKALQNSIEFSQTADTTEWNNAPYSKAFTVI